MLSLASFVSEHARVTPDRTALRLGERNYSYGQLEEGSSLTPEALREWSEERLAPYKYSRGLEGVDALPMNATGKILRRKLRAAERVSV